MSLRVRATSRGVYLKVREAGDKFTIADVNKDDEIRRPFKAAVTFYSERWMAPADEAAEKAVEAELARREKVKAKAQKIAAAKRGILADNQSVAAELERISAELEEVKSAGVENAALVQTLTAERDEARAEAEKLAADMTNPEAPKEAKRKR